MNASILDFLKANGERLDAEIAEALQVPVTLVTSHVSQLSSAGEVICCKVTRYIDGRKVEGVSCRLACNMPAPARGRKPGAKRGAGPDTNAA
jgi:predicted transcriptional regulator